MFTWIWWYIWKARNNIIFRNFPWYPRAILQLAGQATHEWQVATHLFKRAPSKSLPADTWRAPPLNLTKCSIDGSFDYQSKTSGIVGIIRDHNGSLIQAFASAISAVSALEAEIQALMRGAQLFIQLGI